MVTGQDPPCGVLVQAPLDRIARIIAGTDALRTLLDGGWMTLHARETPDQPWDQYGPDGFRTHERNRA